jgi:hypothetical protein
VISLNFDPFIDYELLDQTRADGLHLAVRQYRDAVDAFVADEHASTLKARVVSQKLEAMDKTATKIMSDLWTVPVMVHVAGEKKTEKNPDNPEHEVDIQRCQRCASILNFWHEDMAVELPDGFDGYDVDDDAEQDHHWWSPGDVVGKVGDESHIGVYSIDPKRELYKHERECVSLSELVGRH